MGTPLRGRSSYLTLAVLVVCLSAGGLGAPALAAEPDGKSADEWHLYGGNAVRSRQASGSAPFLEPRWEKGFVRTEDAKTWLDQAADALKAAGRPVLSGGVPITVTIKRNQAIPLVIYRSHWGVHAVNADTGELFWEAGSHWSLDWMVRDPGKQPAVSAWVNFYLKQQPAVLLGNSTLGTLSTNGTHAFVVESLAVPPPPAVPNGMDFDGRRNLGGYARYGQAIADAIQHGRLQAFDLITGKLIWELGGIGARNEKAELTDCHFLSAPLPFDGKLYVLIEKDLELRLAALNPETGKVFSTQTLAAVATKMGPQPIRRIQAAHLACADGIMVCPTNAGAVVGVDLASASVAWAHAYRSPEDVPATPVQPELPRLRRLGQMQVPFQPLGSFWHVTAPIIHDGKVVFTAPDSRSIHCLRLRDGSKVWSQKAVEHDCYLGGVIENKVLIVGSRSCRALSLDKGETVWSLETGMPSGQGIAANNIYYLPLKEGVKSKVPEVCAIDVATGIIAGHSKSRKKIIPGNLLFCQGDLLSQTATTIAVFPQLKTKLRTIDERLRKDPTDAVGLYERATLRMDDGNLAGAAADLVQVLSGSPPQDLLPRTQVKLYEALTELLGRDFNAGEKYLADYRQLLTLEIPPDKSGLKKLDPLPRIEQRQIIYQTLLARGREKQGKLVEALQACLDLAGPDMRSGMLLALDGAGPRVTRLVWARARIGALLTRANAEQRKELEEAIRKRWEALRDSKDLDALRDFAAVLPASAVGRDILLALSDRLVEKQAFVQADLCLQELRRQTNDPLQAAQALERLVQLCARRGLLADSVAYARVLAHDYPELVVRDGKTGAALLAELANDKRYLPYLADQPRFPADVKLKAHDERGPFPLLTRFYSFSPEAEPGVILPSLRSTRFNLRFDIHALELIDSATGQVRASISLTRTNFENMIAATDQATTSRYHYQTLGHLVLLPIGHMVFAIDLVNRKVIWEKHLAVHNEQQDPEAQSAHEQLGVDPRDGSLLITYPGGWRQRFGGRGVLQPSACCLTTYNGLLAVDPATGRTLWLRDDLRSPAYLFADARHVFVVETNQAGQPASTRVLQLSDGRDVSVPDFTAQYTTNQGIVGGALLLADTGPMSELTLHLHDVVTGKDRWKQTFSAGWTLLRSLDPDVTAILDSKGVLKVLRLADGKLVGEAALDARKIDGYQSASLLSDDRCWYVATDKGQDAQTANLGGVQANVPIGSGLLSVPVHGFLHAIDRNTGKVRWYTPVEKQRLLLEQFHTSPVVVLASRHKVQRNAGQQIIEMAALLVINKSNGKRLYDKDVNSQDSQIHAVNVDPVRKRVDVNTVPLRVSVQVDPDK
jgi:outer membrane protein assembly factor BamB